MTFFFAFYFERDFFCEEKSVYFVVSELIAFLWLMERFPSVDFYIFVLTRQRHWVTFLFVSLTDDTKHTCFSRGAVWLFLATWLTEVLTQTGDILTSDVRGRVPGALWMEHNCGRVMMMMMMMIDWQALCEEEVNWLYDCVPIRVSEAVCCGCRAVFAVEENLFFVCLFFWFF